MNESELDRERASEHGRETGQSGAFGGCRRTAWFARCNLAKP